MSALPPRRLSVVYAPVLAGHRVHVTVGRHPSGPIGEVWIDLHKEGAPLRGFASALARLASLSLQAGVPLAVVVRALRGTEGGPEGAVTECDGVTEAWSVPDLVARVLEVAEGEP